MKQKVNAFDYANEIVKALPKGVLLTTKADGRVNTMTIGWGEIGVKWGKPIFIAFVRESRFTKEMLEKNPEFTVNVPMGEADRKIISLCGTQSGRDVDKIAACGLSLEEGEAVSVPGIRELPLTLECRVIYRQAQDPQAIPPEILSRYYPQNVDSAACGANRDFHTAFYGEIVGAYLAK